MSRLTFAVIALVFTASGVGLLVAALRKLVEWRAFMAESSSARGEVVGFAEVREGVHPSYFPEVAFRTAEGHAIRFQSQLGSEQPDLAVGDTVRVRYHTARPNEAELDSFWSLWGLVALLGALGVAFTAIGVGLLASRLFSQ
jgi:hypothetical protein